MLITLEELREHPVRFDEVFAPGHIDYAIEGLSQTAPLKAKGTASAIENEIHIRGTLSTELQMECARCLEPMQQPVERSFDLYYQPLQAAPPVDEVEVPRGEEEIGFYSGEALLLEDVAKEQVILSLPMRSVCREDCKGLCPICGLNLNRESCSCQAQTGDSRWEALKNLT